MSEVLDVSTGAPGKDVVGDERWVGLECAEPLLSDLRMVTREAIVTQPFGVDREAFHHTRPARPSVARRAEDQLSTKRPFGRQDGSS